MSLWANSPLQVGYEAFRAIPSAMEAIKAGRRIVVSSDNAAEVGLIGGSDCLVADHLQEVCAFLAGQTSLSPPRRGACSG